MNHLLKKKKKEENCKLQRFVAHSSLQQDCKTLFFVFSFLSFFQTSEAEE